MSIHYQDDAVTLHSGKAVEVLRSLPDQSVDCCVTSPPYYGLRSYLPEGHPDKIHEIGTEKTPAEFVEKLRALFAEVRRVLADDGTLWLNLGDSYSSKSKGTGGGGGKSTLGICADGTMSLSPEGVIRAVSRQQHAPTTIEPGVPDKNLLGIPWRTAFALQDDGWILRNAIIWHKPNAMPESVTDRLSGRYEHLFLFSKSRRYWFALDSIREAHSEKSIYQQQVARNRPHAAGKAGAAVVPGSAAQSGMAAGGRELNIAGANPGDVWSMPTVPFPGSHFAVFPPELPRRCIAAGCKPGGTVLDPFSGSGTTGMVAQKLGRKYVGIDLNPEYLALSLRTRLAHHAMAFPA